MTAHPLDDPAPRPRSATATIGSAVDDLRSARDDWSRDRTRARDTASFPSRWALASVVETLGAAIYPRRLGRFTGKAAEEDGFVAAKLIAAFTDLEREIAAELGYWQRESSDRFDADQPGTIVRLFGATLGEIRRLVDSDVEAIELLVPSMIDPREGLQDGAVELVGSRPVSG